MPGVSGDKQGIVALRGKNDAVEDFVVRVGERFKARRGRGYFLAKGAHDSDKFINFFSAESEFASMKYIVVLGDDFLAV